MYEAFRRTWDGALDWSKDEKMPMEQLSEF